MERLLYSSSPSSTLIKTHLNSSPSLPPRLARVDSLELVRFSLNRPKLKRDSSDSFRIPYPFLSSSSPPTQLSPLRASRVYSCTESTPNSVPLNDTTSSNVVLGQRKTISPGTVLVISAVIAFLVNPIFAPSAFASFQTAAKTGGPLLRTELLNSAWTGFLAGCLHTLSGPDHLAALAPLSIGRTRLESAAVGALWGCGHDAGQVLFGLMFLLLKDRLHIEVIRTWGTRVVGFTLLVIGALGIREASEVPTPCVALENGECDVSMYESLVTPVVEKKKKKIGFATFATGIVHGLQPDALMIILPALALPSRVAGVAFLLMFLVGTVVAMGSYTVFLGSCSEALKDKIPRITEKLTWAASLVAIGLGLAIITSQFFGFSLY